MRSHESGKMDSMLITTNIYLASAYKVMMATVIFAKRWLQVEYQQPLIQSFQNIRLYAHLISTISQLDFVFEHVIRFLLFVKYKTVFFISFLRVINTIKMYQLRKDTFWLIFVVSFSVIFLIIKLQYINNNKNIPYKTLICYFNI